VTGARDDTSPVVFAETLLGVGEWLSPHRVNDLAELLWAYDAQQAQGVYRVIQPFRTDVQNFKPVAVACIASTDATLNREEEF
jgi:CRISPR-associated protein Csy2